MKHFNYFRAEPVVSQQVSEGDIIALVDKNTGDPFPRRVTKITRLASSHKWEFEVESVIVTKLNGGHDRLGKIVVDDTGEGYEDYTLKYKRAVAILGRLPEE